MARMASKPFRALVVGTLVFSFGGVELCLYRRDARGPTVGRQG